MSIPKGVTLDNWREIPNTAWAFQHVSELIETAQIAASNAERTSSAQDLPPPQDQTDENKTDHFSKNISVTSQEDKTELTFDQVVSFNQTDALLVAHKGKLVHEHYADHYDSKNPHLIFSVSKSITAMLAGIFVTNGTLDTTAYLSHYIPSLKNSTYADCTLQQLLDMTVSHQFEESYLDKTGLFNDYRLAMSWASLSNKEQSIDENSRQHNLKRFIEALKKGDENHGEVFRYRSPNTDLLGWIIETATSSKFVDLVSDNIWKPIGAEANAEITIDRIGTSRAAGGMSVTARDLIRFGEMVRHMGVVNGTTVVPESWIADTLTNGNPEVWKKGDFSELLEHGQYRNKWYRCSPQQRALFGFGIHGQYVYVDFERETTIVQFASHPDPLNLMRDKMTIDFFETISRQCAG